MTTNRVSDFLRPDDIDEPPGCAGCPGCRRHRDDAKDYYEWSCRVMFAAGFLCASAFFLFVLIKRGAF